MVVQVVSADYLKKVVNEFVPHGLFLAQDTGTWVAVDNSTGEAWAEAFERKRLAVRWLRREAEA